MKSAVKVLSEMGNHQRKALLLQLPHDMIRRLKISNDGMISVKSLIGVLMMLEQETCLKELHKSSAFENT